MTGSLDQSVLLTPELKPFSDLNLQKTITIRGEERSVLEAIQRESVHYAMHVGQIVFLAKHFETENWESLSIPRGQSEKFFRLK